MKQFTILFASILLASPALSAPAAHPFPTQAPSLPIEQKQKRQDSTITYTRVPLSSGIPSITESYSPGPTDSDSFSATPTDTDSDSSLPSSTASDSATTTGLSLSSSSKTVPTFSSTDSHAPTSTHSSVSSSSKTVPTFSSTDSHAPTSTHSSVSSSSKTIPTFSSTPSNSISLIPSSTLNGGTTIDQTRTLSFPGGQTRTYTFGGQTVTLTLPGSPILTAAANPARQHEKRQLLPLTDEGRSWTTESILPASTLWNDGGPVRSLTLSAGGVRATDTPNVQLAEGGGKVVEVIKRQTDIITWGGELPTTTYWGELTTIAFGTQTIVFTIGPGERVTSVTADAVGAGRTAEPAYTNV